MERKRDVIQCSNQARNVHGQIVQLVPHIHCIRRFFRRAAMETDSLTFLKKQERWTFSGRGSVENIGKHSSYVHQDLVFLYLSSLLLTLYLLFPMTPCAWSNNRQVRCKCSHGRDWAWPYILHSLFFPLPFSSYLSLYPFIFLSLEVSLSFSMLWRLYHPSMTYALLMQCTYEWHDELLHGNCIHRGTVHWCNSTSANDSQLDMIAIACQLRP